MQYDAHISNQWRKMMRAKGLAHGRFVALSGLRKIPGPPGSSFPLIVLDRTGQPIFFLSEWYRRKKEFDPGRTPDTYLEMLLPWVGFLLQRGYDWDDTPDRIRAFLVEFLRGSVGCDVGPASVDGYEVQTTGASPLSKSSLGVLLAALASLYDLLTDAGYYPHQNPMRSQRLIELKREHLRQVKNAGAPDHAGIRSETQQETHQNYPTRYFRQRRGKVWEPEVVMEPDDVHERMNTTIDYMIQHASFQRDQVILLLLRQTGARLSEIIEMTVGGYRNAQHRERALVKNKGSRGREEKPIYFTPIIEEQLLRYIRTERAQHDLRGHNRLEQLDDTDPLFITEDGNPYSRSAFYHHWNRLFEPAQKQFRKKEQVEFTPHDIRHLRVTRAMKRIKEQAKADENHEKELKEGFSQLMGWSSSRTMEIYTHVLKKREALLKVMLEAEEESHIERLAHDPTEARKNTAPTLSPPPLEEDFSWYEEE
jgi:integrase